ncbi:dicarboxylate/amino acid:cation symporter, partial [Pedobacter sp.]
MKKSKIGIITLVSVTIAVILTLLKEFNLLAVSDLVMMSTRWLVAIVLVCFAVSKKSLTTWILVCMLLGVFVGVDFPNFAAALHPLSKGFIKLVKTIVGPILFGTLVYGIAGHSDLKQVGRMAWKSMLYFFCATSCAIFIGLAVINITHAGVGVNMEKMPQQQLPTVKAVDTELEALPENVKGVYKFAHFFYELFPE